jgi:signal transduction histidine kinase
MLTADAIRRSWRTWWLPFYCKEGPGWLQYVWTFLFNTAIAVVLTLIAWSFSARGNPLQILKWNFVIAQSIGFLIHLLFESSGWLLGRDRLDAFSKLQRVLYYGGVPILGCLGGYWIGLSLLGVDVARIIQGAPRVALAVIVISIIFSTFWYRFMSNKAQLATAEAERERERSRVAELQRQAADAQLRSLQAQIEPHFLFNTLANVVSLIDIAPDRARQMLERLIDLLRASLAASRTERTTLGQEVALVAAYLEILSIRMGERLRFSIDVPAELASARVPPLSLQPLVENAIRHGLEPKVDGGSVRLVARNSGGVLQLDVEDDGLGFAPASASGVGLTNLRDRLRSLYGDRARLVIEELARGTRVRLTIPQEPA